MLCVVAYLLMIYIVVYFVLVLEIIMVVQVGLLVLLYNCTHYTMHGGCSNRGTYCGTFLIDNGDVASYASWTRAAALLFRQSTHYPMRGGTSSDDTSSGVFFVIIRRDTSSTFWHFGAALSFILHIIMLCVADLLIVILVVV